MGLAYPIERQREAERKWQRRFEQAERASRARQGEHGQPAGVGGACPYCGVPSPVDATNAIAHQAAACRRWVCAACGHVWPTAAQLAS